MSYKYETQYNSPNYTPGNQVAATWGRPRTIEAIAIHWWGDPNQGPTYEGVIAHFENPNAGVSAHFVVTGTGRRAAQLLNFEDASWATNSANPYTISIECDPRCRDEDYDTVAEVIASIRSAYGDLPLVPHRQFIQTACPGNYDLGRLDAIARTKDASGDWGDVHDINQAPAPAPQPAPAPAPTYDNLYRLTVGGRQVSAYSSEQNAYNGYVAYGSSGTINFHGNDVTQALVTKYKPAPVVPPVEVKPTPQPETPPKGTESSPEPSQPESGTSTQVGTTTLLEDVKKWFLQFLNFLSKYKRSK